MMTDTYAERRALRAAQRETARQVAARNFPDLGVVVRNTLVRAGYSGRAVVQITSDRDLCAVRGLGRGRVAEIRRVLPYVPPIRLTCAHCGGRGYVEKLPRAVLI